MVDVVVDGADVVVWVVVDGDVVRMILRRASAYVLWWLWWGVLCGVGVE